MIEVIDAGLLSTVQDLGRPGYGRWGIAPSGAADQRSLRLANRLVGNAESAAGIEILLGRFVARFTESATVAVSGAWCDVLVGDRPGRMDGPFSVPAGETLTLGLAIDGARTYLAVRGGIDSKISLGSRSTDVGAGLGVPRLVAGTTLPVGNETDGLPNTDIAPVRRPGQEPVLNGVLGPRDDLFTDEAVRRFTTSTYTVMDESDRVGVRLRGFPLERLDRLERPSEGTVAGAVEVPPDGQPILFLADHPSTCGYPVIAVLDEESVASAAQFRPGHQVSFSLSRLPGFL